MPQRPQPVPRRLESYARLWPVPKMIRKSLGGRMSLYYNLLSNYGQVIHLSPLCPTRRA